VEITRVQDGKEKALGASTVEARKKILTGSPCARARGKGNRGRGQKGRQTWGKRGRVRKVERTTSRREFTLKGDCNRARDTEERGRGGTISPNYAQGHQRGAKLDALMEGENIFTAPDQVIGRKPNDLGVELHKVFGRSRGAVEEGTGRSRGKNHCFIQIANGVRRLHDVIGVPGVPCRKGEIREGKGLDKALTGMAVVKDLEDLGGDGHVRIRHRKR
jgi:hypothetical protein